MIAIAPLLLLIAAPVADRTTIGVYGSWGAFSDAGARSCFAVAQPADRQHRAGSVSLGTWPDRNVRNQFYVRLSRPRAASTGVTLSIGERRFDLIGTGADAWASDTRTDAAIVGAMRSGRSMSVEAVDQNGYPFADTYTLSGAATAIDAAALACRR